MDEDMIEMNCVVCDKTGSLLLGVDMPTEECLFHVSVWLSEGWSPDPVYTCSDECREVYGKKQ